MRGGLASFDVIEIPYDNNWCYAGVACVLGIWYYNLGCNVEAYMLSLVPHWETQPWCCDVGASASSARTIDGAHVSCKQCRVSFMEITKLGVMLESVGRFRVANNVEF